MSFSFHLDDATSSFLVILFKVCYDFVLKINELGFNVMNNAR